MGVCMRGRLSFRNAVIVSYSAMWFVWNLLSYQLTVEIAGIQDKWQPLLTILRVIFPFMYLGAPFLPEWFSLLGFMLFPLVFLSFARFLAKDWSLKLGAIAGAVWALAVGLSAALSPHESQAGRLYHLARGEVGAALGPLLAMGVLELLMVAVAFNALVFFGFQFAERFVGRPKSEKPKSEKPAPDPTAEEG